MFTGGVGRHPQGKLPIAKDYLGDPSAKTVRFHCEAHACILHLQLTCFIDLYFAALVAYEYFTRTISWSALSCMELGDLTLVVFQDDMLW